MASKKIFHSFAELGSALHVSVKQVEHPVRQKKCRICGAVMKSIPGTNVAVCTGTVTNDKGVEEACKNRAISSILPVKEVVLV